MPHTSTAEAGATSAMLPDSTDLVPSVRVPPPAFEVALLACSVSALPTRDAPLPPAATGSEMGTPATLPEPVEPWPVVRFSPPAHESFVVSLTAVALPPAAAALSSTVIGPASAGSTMLPASVAGSPLVRVVPPVYAPPVCTESVVALPAPATELPLTSTRGDSGIGTALPEIELFSPLVVTSPSEEANVSATELTFAMPAAPTPLPVIWTGVAPCSETTLPEIAPLSPLVVMGPPVVETCSAVVLVSALPPAAIALPVIWTGRMWLTATTLPASA